MYQAIENLAMLVGQRLQANHLRLATAESCTGGGLSYWITSIPGSSSWYDRGFITYNNEAKKEMLNVSAATLERFSAVSSETVQEMAEGALAHSKANISLAITGIAGPEGGSHKMPVGTVWLGWAAANSATASKKFIFTGDRQQVREQAIVHALEILIEMTKPDR